jgi:SET domain-containing protein
VTRRAVGPARATRVVEVRESAVHGKGLFARTDIDAGVVIGRYAGLRLAEHAIRDREWDHALTYVFGLSDGTVIDGAHGGNATRHFNHSCEPNCEAVEYWTARGEMNIRFEALRAIACGEELTIDYALQSEDPPAHFPCACGSHACRGTLLDVG